VADDNPQILAMVNNLLQADFEVVDMVSDGDSLVRAAFRLHPDVIVTDISMPNMKEIEAVRMIRDTMPWIKFIFLTMHAATAYKREAQSVGAVGYVLKSAAVEELSPAIHHAVDNP
jgi:DNA-binding NarL/FixJ family response regulator